MKDPMSVFTLIKLIFTGIVFVASVVGITMSWVDENHAAICGFLLAACISFLLICHILQWSLCCYD